LLDFLKAAWHPSKRHLNGLGSSGCSRTSSWFCCCSTAGKEGKFEDEDEAEGDEDGGVDKNRGSSDESSFPRTEELAGAQPSEDLSSGGLSGGLSIGIKGDGRCSGSAGGGIKKKKKKVFS
jgi:hypothetical protein